MRLKQLKNTVFSREDCLLSGEFCAAILFHMADMIRFPDDIFVSIGQVVLLFILCM